MKIDKDLIEKLIFNEFHQRTRFTQDSPVYPDVWMEYFEHLANLSSYRADLILTPHRQSSASELSMLLSQKLQQASGSSRNGSKWRIATNGETIAACLTLKELLTIALPMTNWWQKYLWKNEKETADMMWLKELIGAIYFAKDNRRIISDKIPQGRQLELYRKKYTDNFGKIDPQKLAAPPITLWAISRNRPANITIEKSVPTTKADSCRRLFEIDGSEITWAIMDTGIDARNLAFRKTDPKTKMPFPAAMGKRNDPLSNNTRITATYDFTGFRNIVSAIFGSDKHSAAFKKELYTFVTCDKHDKSLSEQEQTRFIQEIERALKSGRLLDWTILSPLLRIPHNDEEYVPPTHPHGTHVAGIIGAGVKDGSANPMTGMCPGISLYDIRVLDANGNGDEFNILAAIQFLRWMNNQKDGIIIHGANMSFSMVHEVASYACGQTPVCDACSRLVADGAIVVAAAGNLGQTMFQDKEGRLMQGFRCVNITDPGNAEDVITVGATHRDRPYSYGVSYFSSRGPTGDGRAKPDLVAPGEKIVSTSIDDGVERMDGTSQAAPHVSGAAALLLAKHHELVGRPKRVKQILCNTATDLGREKYFQGSGMLDVLRAIQSV